MYVLQFIVIINLVTILLHISNHIDLYRQNDRMYQLSHFVSCVEVIIKNDKAKKNPNETKGRWIAEELLWNNFGVLCRT